MSREMTKLTANRASLTALLPLGLAHREVPFL
ncbi:hypothetical protein GBAR_LOCUS20914 [Geodia barretti]|uniref:Uncharacterized protein n=1 Tax=Geodia barretti TaxID=519541 RepID=A0AA35SXQ8_GEOBA|nr:hypothetical protein GBAR_LOCUS20914 [Geodia barretti]